MILFSINYISNSIDGDIPASAVLSSASLHDSQVATPLTQMTAGWITSLYGLINSAYDAPQINAHSTALGNVSNIDIQRGGLL